MSELILYDTRKKQKKTFNKEDLKDFTTYTCGPTVYGDAHIGNYRPPLISSLLHRLVAYISEKNPRSLQCITDIDDKIIKKAKELQLSPKNISTKFSRLYKNYSKKLRLIEFKYLKVTDHIKGILDYIELLENNKYINIKENEVTFKTKKLGKLYWQFASPGNKTDNLDFSLWKLDKKEGGYESKYGIGRPGWHTECATFIYLYGKNHTVDVHIAGCDLGFPHNQNEIAQHVAITKNENLAKVWLHVGNLTLDNKKMSKSRNNIILMSEMLEVWTWEVIKLWMLSVNYKNTLNYTTRDLGAYNKMYRKWQIQLTQISLLMQLTGMIQDWKKTIKDSKIDKIFLKFLSNNLNTQFALIRINDFFSTLQKEVIRIENWDINILCNCKNNRKSEKVNLVESILGQGNFVRWGCFVKTLAFFLNDSSFFIKEKTKKEVDLIKDWQKYLNKKEYKKADKVREKLKLISII